MLTRDEYVAALRGLMSGDPARVRDANRLLYGYTVGQPTDALPLKAAERNGVKNTREADLALAEAGM